MALGGVNGGAKPSHLTLTMQRVTWMIRTALSDNRRSWLCFPPEMIVFEKVESPALEEGFVWLSFYIHRTRFGSFDYYVTLLYEYRNNKHIKLLIEHT
jgi:hypothetical protein